MITDADRREAEEYVINVQGCSRESYLFESYVQTYLAALTAERARALERERAAFEAGRVFFGDDIWEYETYSDYEKAREGR